MPEIDGRIVITRENIFPGLTLTRSGNTIRRVIGFDPQGEAYERRGYGTRLVGLDRKYGDRQGQFYSEWGKLGTSSKRASSGLTRIRASIEDVEDAYNRRLASRSTKKAVLGEAATMTPEGRVKIKEDEVAIWEKMNVEGQKAYLVYPTDRGEFYEEV